METESRDREKIDEMTAYISKVQHAILATSDGGAPHTRYIYFVNDGLRLYLFAFPEISGTVKDRNRVSVLIPFIVRKEGGQDLSDYRYVSIEGEAQTLKGQERDKILGSYGDRILAVKEAVRSGRSEKFVILDVNPFKATYFTYIDFFQQDLPPISVELRSEVSAQAKEDIELTEEEEVLLDEDLFGEESASLDEEAAPESQTLTEEEEDLLKSELSALDDLDISDEDIASLEADETVSAPEKVEEEEISLEDIDAIEEQLISLEDELDLEKELGLEEDPGSGSGKGKSE